MRHNSASRYEKKVFLFSCYVNIDSADFKRLRCCTNNKQFGVNSALNQSRLLLYALISLSNIFYFILPGVVSSTVDCSSFDETGRLSVEGRPADGTPADEAAIAVLLLRFESTEHSEGDGASVYIIFN